MTFDEDFLTSLVYGLMSMYEHVIGHHYASMSVLLNLLMAACIELMKASCCYCFVCQHF